MEKTTETTEINERATDVRDKLSRVTREIGKAIVGNERIVEDVLVCLLCGGHALIEGVPGLGKTYLIRTLGEVLDLATSRIQFTPDLMPADILGTNVLVHGETGEQTITFQKGPVFAQIVLADEINRATPKTQSALLESMQEKAVTVGGVRYALELPFIVLATQNPLEMEGTYPLPEAQLDRFFFKLDVTYPSGKEISTIVDRTTGIELPEPGQVLGREEVLGMQRFIREVPVPKPVKEYAIRLVLATHPEKDGATKSVARYVRYGSSPRGAQSLVLASKVYALLDGRINVDFEDIRKASLPSLRHRIILSFEGEAEGVTGTDIVKEITAQVGETGQERR